MLIKTSDNYLYHEKVYMTYNDGQIWVALKDIKETLNSMRNAQDGKYTTKKLEKIVESLDIIPVRFKNSSSLYVTWVEANKVEKAFIAHRMRKANNKAFDLKTD